MNYELWTMNFNRLLKDKEALGTHVEQQIHDAEVGTKTEAGRKHLIVCRRVEGGVGGIIALGVDKFAEVSIPACCRR